MSTSLWLMLAAAWAGPDRLPPPTSVLGEKQDQMVPMPDGVALRTRVFLPDGEGPWPVIFIRNPYPIPSFLDHQCETYVRYQYACVWQMVRGRSGSGGEWSPFIHDRDDGIATIEWISGQPWSEEALGMLGPSYLGGVQWAMSGAMPPSVKTIVPMVFGTDMYSNAYEGGMFRHELVGTFVTLIPDDGFYALGGRRYQRALAHRPRRELAAVAARGAVPWTEPWMDAWLRSDPFWQSAEVQAMSRAADNIDIPVLVIAGWSDAFLGSQLDTWAALATRSDSTLVVGPWDHLGASVGDIPIENVDDDTGLADTYFQTARVLDWMDHHLKGAPARYPVGKTLTYVVGDNRWAVRDAWPPPTTPQVWSLGPGDAADCAAELRPEASGSAAVVTYRYDPEDPTPSLGGAGSLAAVLPTYRGVPAGFIDQGRLCQRRDDLVGWVSAPLEAPLHIAGAAAVRLLVSSDAPDTAFSVRLLEVRPDGDVIHVREGIRALSFRDGDDARRAYTPGEQVQLDVETWPVEYVFQPGSQVMLQVASASFPKFEAHSNTTVHWADAVETVPATQSIHLSGTTVTLPVVAPGRP